MDAKFGKFSEDTIRAAILRDRESAAAATESWHHSHGCVIDREGTILTWIGGQKNLYHGSAGRDPSKDLANARFMVSARNSVERRCDMIEALLEYIAKLETKSSFPNTDDCEHYWEEGAGTYRQVCHKCGEMR